MSGRFENLFFRPITRDDLPTLHRWIQRPHVAEWWNSPSTLADVEDDYVPSITGATSTKAYIASLNQVPVGFIQAYVVMDSGGGWWESGNDPGARGVDQFLADPDRLNQGLGTAMIRNFVASLFDDPAVTKVQTDPSPATDAASEAFTRRKPRRT